MKLNPKQLSYLKGLDSKKKQRKFLLDCLVENILHRNLDFDKIIEESTNVKKIKISDLPIVEKCEICQRYPKNELVNSSDEIKNIEVDFENVSQKENN